MQALLLTYSMKETLRVGGLYQARKDKSLLSRQGQRIGL